MLLDEPTDGIQPNIITQIGKVISHLRDQKTMAIVLVKQYFDFAFGLADHIYAVTRGKVVYESKKFNIDKSKLRASVGVKSVQATSRQDQPDMQRARGAIDLAIVAGKLERFYQSGSAKIFMPKTYAATIEAVLVNTAGGLTAGDDFQVKLSADSDTHLTVSTQTAERIYRALGHQHANMRIDMELTGAASLHWLPQETILFDGARFSRQLNVEMDEGASFLASEMMVFGRTAMNETVLKGSLQDQWRIRRGGKLIHAEALRLDSEIAQKLSQVASATSSICLSTILYISRDAEACVNAVRIFFKDYPEVKTAVTAWDGKLIIRSLGNDTAQLKKLLAQFIEQFRKIANPRVWNY